MGVDVDDVDWSRVDKVKFALYGGGITLVMDVLLYPLEVIKTRMMIDTKVCNCHFRTSCGARLILGDASCAFHHTASRARRRWRSHFSQLCDRL